MVSPVPDTLGYCIYNREKKPPPYKLIFFFLRWHRTCSGNCVVRGGLGPTALDRYSRDVLSQSGVRSVIIFEGVQHGMPRVMMHVIVGTIGVLFTTAALGPL